MEPAESVQLNIYQGNTYRNKLDTFRRRGKDSRHATSEGPTALHISFCGLSNNSKHLLGAPAQT